MTREERIEELAAALDPLVENQIPCLWEMDCYGLAAQLIAEGFGNLRDYRAKIIELYLKGNTAELIKFIMEEV